jgi:multicomponent Na+:H+ antiporter subunit B
MGFLIKTVARWTKGFLLVFSFTLILYGHLTHGDGFSGGIMIACVFIALVLVEGKTVSARILSRSAAATIGSVSTLVMIALAILGMVHGGAFLRNLLFSPDARPFTLFSAGILPLFNLCVGVIVGMFLFTYFTIIADYDASPAQDEKEEAK